MPWNHAQRVAYYQRTRQEILAVLGNQCELCGQVGNETSDGENNPLEIDHINGRNYILSRLSRWQRAAMWKQELKEKKLRTLCRQCNAHNGGGKRYHGPDF